MVLLGQVKVRDLIRLLESNGWRLKTVRGSHRQFKHPDKRMVVTVAGQNAKDIPIGTLKAVLKAAELEEDA
jgi:predicted RNA binding protein YcfA (HicA-like mRNA interferase family)